MSSNRYLFKVHLFKAYFGGEVVHLLEGPKPWAAKALCGVLVPLDGQGFALTDAHLSCYVCLMAEEGE